MTASIQEKANESQNIFDEKQRKTCDSRGLEGVVTKRVRVTFEFTPVPLFIEREIETPALEKLYRIFMRFARRGISDPSLRVLAKAMGRVDRTVQRYIRALVRLGKLIVQVRRVTRNRNATNVYILPDLQRGVGDKNVTEKLRAELKTTTPTPAARVEVIEAEDHKTPLRKFWEARFAQDTRDSNWRREEFQRKATWWETLKNWRLDKALERTRLAADACVGVAREELPPLTAAERAEFDRQMAELDAKAESRREAAGELQRRREAEYAESAVFSGARR